MVFFCPNSSLRECFLGLFNNKTYVFENINVWIAVFWKKVKKIADNLPYGRLSDCLFGGVFFEIIFF